MLTLCFLGLLAHGLSPNPHALPPSVKHMVLTAPRPKRPAGYDKAQRKAAMLAHIVFEPVFHNRVRTTKIEQLLAFEVVKASKPEAFLSDGAERKALQKAVARFRAGVSPSVLKATIGGFELPDWLQR